MDTTPPEAGHCLAERPYECTQCDKCFLCLSHLKQHEYTHGNKPFKCKQCGTGFNRPSTRARHMKVHEERTEYICVHCDMTFMSYNTLISHQRTHSGEKPFKCKVCDRSFGNEGNMRRHAQAHEPQTKIPEYSCMFCPATFASHTIRDGHEREQHASL